MFVSNRQQNLIQFFSSFQQNSEDRREASLHQDTGVESGTDEDVDDDNGGYGDDEDDDDHTEDDVIDFLDDESEQVLPSESDVVGRDENMPKNDITENGRQNNQSGNFSDDDVDYQVLTCFLNTD